MMVACFVFEVRNEFLL